MRILFDPCMRHQLCPWLAAVLLFGALSLGNPFLRRQEPAASAPGAQPAAPAPGAQPAPENREGGQTGGAGSAAAAFADEAEPVLDRPSIRTLPIDAASRHESPLGQSAPIAQLAAAGAGPAFAVPAMAVQPVSSALRATAKAWPKCPDPALEDLVVDFEAAGIEPVWVLRDGRRVTRSGLLRREQ